MTIEVKILRDSLSPDNVRLTTFQLRYPRQVHSELMTHRLFSRNASSTRAVPLPKQIQNVVDDTAVPYWTMDMPGMQGEPADTAVADQATRLWLEARDNAIDSVNKLIALGIHKQDAGRLLEPFSHISVVLSSTEWHHFMDVRPKPKAHRMMQELANKIADELRVCQPATVMGRRRSNLLEEWLANWHLPYVSHADLHEAYEGTQTPDTPLYQMLGANQDIDHEHVAPLISAARCARVSYLNHGGGRNLALDLELGIKLYRMHHWSALEHAARPMTTALQDTGNFTSWLQLRKMLEHVPTEREWP